MPELDTLAAIALGSVPVIGLGLAGHNAYITARADKRRNQPVVIAHLLGDLISDATGQRRALIQLENAGGGPAFDVRAGVEFKGERFPYLGDDAVDHLPSRLRVLLAGAMIPPESPTTERPTGFPVTIDSTEAGDPYDARDIVCWCWFKNSYGHTWETRNPADPSSDLGIRRVWHPEATERRHAAAYRPSLRATHDRTVRRITAPGESDNS